MADIVSVRMVWEKAGFEAFYSCSGGGCYIIFCAIYHTPTNVVTVVIECTALLTLKP